MRTKTATIVAAACICAGTATAAEAPGYTPWQQVQHLDVMAPDHAHRPIADAWRKYGNKPLGAALAQPLTYATFTRGNSHILAGIALSPGCDTGPNDVSSTQLHAVCPMVVIVETAGQYRRIEAPSACYMWTADLPQSAETDPRTNATYMRMNEITGVVEVTTTRKGMPIKACVQKVGT